MPHKVPQRNVPQKQILTHGDDVQKTSFLVTHEVVLNDHEIPLLVLIQKHPARQHGAIGHLELGVVVR